MDQPEPRITLSVPQGEFVKAYLDESSPSFLNTAKAAEEANLPLTTANSLATLKTKWFREFAEESPLLQKAEENLASILDLPVTDYDHGQTVAKVSMFIAERLGKERYSTRSELTAKDGKDLVPKEDVELRILNLRRKQID